MMIGLVDFLFFYYLFLSFYFNMSQLFYFDFYLLPNLSHVTDMTYREGVGLLDKGLSASPPIRQFKPGTYWRRRGVENALAST